MVHASETGQIRFWRARFQTPNSVNFLAPHRVPGIELSEFPLGLLFVCKSGLTEFFSHNSPSLPLNLVSPLFRNSTLETVFRPVPNAALACAPARLQENPGELLMYWFRVRGLSFYAFSGGKMRAYANLFHQELFLAKDHPKGYPQGFPLQCVSPARLVAPSTG